jgi:ABC-type glycerol-3-phosphate transport system substrate-binding protein
MKIPNLGGSNKLFYILAGAIVFIIFITVIIILGSVGGGGTQKANLEFWGVFDTRQDIAKILSNYQQVDPGIKVNYRQFSFEDYEKALIDALAAGTGPDVIMIHNSWPAKHRDKFSPMPEVSSVKDYKFMTPTGFQSQFVDVAYKDLVLKDKIYALPLYVDTLALFYNKDMFNTAGITAPPKNWDEFNKDVQLLTKFDSSGNITQAGAAIGTARNINRSTDILAALMLQNGTQMTNTTNSAASFTRTVSGQRVGENALQYYTDFANPQKAVYTWNDQQHYSIDAFVEQGVAMMFNYSHQISAVTGRYHRLNFGIAPLPQSNELDSKNYANYWAVTVSAQSKYKEAAWRFLAYLTSKEGAMSYLAQTSRPSARRDVIDIQRNDATLGVFAVQALSAKSWYQIDNNSIDQIFADMIDEVNLKRTSIRNALRAAESKITTLMTRQ